MTGEEYIAFLRARNPEVYIQNSSGVPVKWIVTRAYTNGVSAKHRVDVEEKNYSYEDTGFFPFVMLMTKEQAAKRQEEIAKKAKPLKRICPTCGAAFTSKDPRKIYCSAKCQKEQNRKETVRKYWERMESEERPILTCPVCGKKFQQKHCEKICSDECRAKKAIEAGKKIRAVRQQLKKEREEILGVEIKLAKKIKKEKSAPGAASSSGRKEEKNIAKHAGKRESHGGSNEEARGPYDHSKNRSRNIPRDKEILQGKET